jgi:hypothetical protein
MVISGLLPQKPVSDQGKTVAVSAYYRVDAFADAGTCRPLWSGLRGECAWSTARSRRAGPIATTGSCGAVSTERPGSPHNWSACSTAARSTSPTSCLARPTTRRHSPKPGCENRGTLGGRNRGQRLPGLPGHNHTTEEAIPRRAQQNRQRKQRRNLQRCEHPSNDSSLVSNHGESSTPTIADPTPRTKKPTMLRAHYSSSRSSGVRIMLHVTKKKRKLWCNCHCWCRRRCCTESHGALVACCGVRLCPLVSSWTCSLNPHAAGSPRAENPHVRERSGNGRASPE